VYCKTHILIEIGSLIKDGIKIFVKGIASTLRGKLCLYIHFSVNFYD